MYKYNFFDLTIIYVAMYNIVLHIAFVAKNQLTRPFIECFEKGTPNFLSVPSCEFVLNIMHCVT